MEKDQEKTSLCLLLPSTSVVGDDVVVNEDVVADSPAVSATSTTIEGEEGGAASSSEDKNKKVFASEEQIRDVFSNDLIAHAVLSHLNFADMKAARVVSRTFLQMVETSKRFKDAQVLRVAKGKCPAGDLNVILNSGRIVRAIRIDVPTLTENSLLTHNFSPVVLENIEFVSLRMDDSIDYTKFDMNALECMVSFIRDLLSSTPNIKNLQIEAKLCDLNLTSVFESTDVKENLKTLRRFDITDHNNCTGINSEAFLSAIWFQRLRSNAWPTHSRFNCWTNNVRLLGSIFQTLESFGMTKERYFLATYNDGTVNPLQSAVVELLQANRESLKELSIHLEAWNNKEIAGVTFPRLRSLTAATNQRGQDALQDFLANHKTLEEIDVAVEHEFLTSLLNGIKLRSANLRKLHLKAKRFIESVGGGEEEEGKVDWRFLGEMTRLRDFKIDRPFCKNADWAKYGNGADFLQSLPQNQLERLSLKGIGAKECGFWRFPDVMGQYIDLELTSKLELLGGFRNLKCLSLRLCPDAVDDKIMEFIVKEMTSLQELEVSHCSQLTDVGFAGTSGDGSDSIRNLRGLKKLSIAYCHLVTSDGLLSCLRLRFLRHFEYVASINVTKDFVLKIMSQNPSLESLAVNSDCEESEVLKEVVKNPRLTKLKSLIQTEKDYDLESQDSSSEEESD